MWIHVDISTTRINKSSGPLRKSGYSPVAYSFAAELALGRGCPASLYFGTCFRRTPQGFGRTSATRDSCFLGNMKTVGWKQGSQNKPFRRLKATARWKGFSRSVEAKADGKTDSRRLPTRLLCMSATFYSPCRFLFLSGVGFSVSGMASLLYSNLMGSSAECKRIGAFTWSV